MNERDYLQPLRAKGPDNPEFVLLRLSHGKSRFWTLQQNMREREIPVVEFQAKPDP